MFIRKAEKQDIGRVVDVHMSSFPGYFLTFLGRKFIGTLYQEILAHPNGIMLVGESDRHILGFVAGVTEQRGFYRHLIKNRKWTFAFSALKALRHKPSIAARLFRALYKSHDSTLSTQACLMSIAVDPGNASKGIGQALLQSFCEELKLRSINCFCLSTDRDGNERVNDFYKKNGFMLAQTFITREGRRMNEWVRTIE